MSRGKNAADAAPGLPAAAAVISPGDPVAVTMVRAHVRGYWLITVAIDKMQAAAIVAGINTALGNTPPQVEAMAAGSMFGWDCPAADPRAYDVHGRIIHDGPADKPGPAEHDCRGW